MGYLSNGGIETGCPGTIKETITQEDRQREKQSVIQRSKAPASLHWKPWFPSWKMENTAIKCFTAC